MKINWRVAEVSGYAYYIERGYRILVSLVDSHGYDFVIEKDGLFSRVNVKVAGLKNKRDLKIWSISRSGTSSVIDSGPVCDIFLVYLPLTGNFIELDGDFFNGSRSKSKILPRGLL